MSRKSKQVEQAAHHAQEFSLTEDLSLLTVADVAALLAVPKSTVYRLVRRRQLEAVRLGRYFRFQRSAVQACINNQQEVSE